MKINKSDLLRTVSVAVIILAAAAIGLTLVGCAPSGPVKTPQQVWIEAHPTHLNERGECIEADDELCDEDPHDLEDFYEEQAKKRGGSKKPSPRPMQTAYQPKPTPKRSR